MADILPISRRGYSQFAETVDNRNACLKTLMQIDRQNCCCDRSKRTQRVDLVWMRLKTKKGTWTTRGTSLENFIMRSMKPDLYLSTTMDCWATIAKYNGHSMTIDLWERMVTCDNSIMAFTLTTIDPWWTSIDLKYLGRATIESTLDQSPRFTI